MTLRLGRWVGCVLASVCIGIAVLIVLFVLDPFGEKQPIPTVVPASPVPATPTIPPVFPSPAPTISSNKITVTTSYLAIVPFGKENGVTPESVAPDLITSMNLLAPQVLLEDTASRKQAKRRIISVITVQLPTSIENLVEVVCPAASMENQNFLCLDVTASVVLITNDGQTIVNEHFTSSLNGAVEEGRLQDFLTKVNSNSQLIVYKGELPLPPASAALMLTRTPGQIPTSVPSVSSSPSLLGQSPAPSIYSTAQAPSNSQAPSGHNIFKLPPTSTPSVADGTLAPSTSLSSLSPTPSIYPTTQAPSINQAPSGDNTFQHPPMSTPSPSSSQAPTRTRFLTSSPMFSVAPSSSSRPSIKPANPRGGDTLPPSVEPGVSSSPVPSTSRLPTQSFFVDLDPGDWIENDPWGGQAVNNTHPDSEGTFRWQNDGNGLELEILNALDDSWQSILEKAVDNWDNGSPIDSLTLSITRVPYEINCEAETDKLKVCNGNYGQTQWMGLNEVLLNRQSNTIVSSSAKLNEYYLKYEGADQKLYTMCHEIGHGFGLPHWDEDFFNANLGNCMDYTDNPATNTQPDTSNFEFLADLYGGRNVTALAEGIPPPGRRLQSKLLQEEEKEEGRRILLANDHSELHWKALDDETAILYHYLLAWGEISN